MPEFELGLGGVKKLGEGVLRDEEGVEPVSSVFALLGGGVCVVCVEDTELKAGPAAGDVSMVPESNELKRAALSTLIGSGAASIE